MWGLFKKVGQDKQAVEAFRPMRAPIDVGLRLERDFLSTLT